MSSRLYGSPSSGKRAQRPLISFGWNTFSGADISRLGDDLETVDWVLVGGILEDIFPATRQVGQISLRIRQYPELDLLIGDHVTDIEHPRRVDRTRHASRPSR
ncbi:MAG: hypothetical protein R2849_00945 [Thermomicrobiales bacterium]